MNRHSRIRRREVIAGLGVGAAAGLCGAAERPGTMPANRAGGVDVDAASLMRQLQADPVGNYVRVVTDLAGTPTFKWFTGRLYAVLPDRPVVPLVGFDSVIRRQARPPAAGSIDIVFAEATVFHDLAFAVIDTFENPVNGRATRPLHYREGPNVLPTSREMFAGEGAGASQTRSDRFLPWTISGSTARFTRESRVDAPHPLDPAVWKLESSGPRFRATTLRSYSVDVAHLADPSRTAVPADYSLTVVSGWFPWMLMGQTPGHLLWHAQGRKVTASSEIPSSVRARIDSRFPEIFASELPWKGPMSFLSWHAQNRRPE